MGADDVLDLEREHRREYSARREPALVEVSRGKYLAISGQGPTRGEAFQARVRALLAVAGAVRVMQRFSDAGRVDYRIGPLEIIHQDAHPVGVTPSAPATPRWILLIRTPDFIREKDLTEAVVRLLEKGGSRLAQEAGLEYIAEGLCVHALHEGPPEEAGAALDRMAEFARTHGLEFHGGVHEIRLTAQEAPAPETERTILRLPVRRSAKAN